MFLSWSFPEVAASHAVRLSETLQRRLPPARLAQRHARPHEVFAFQLEHSGGTCRNRFGNDLAHLRLHLLAGATGHRDGQIRGAVLEHRHDPAIVDRIDDTSHFVADGFSRGRRVETAAHKADRHKHCCTHTPPSSHHATHSDMSLRFLLTNQYPDVSVVLLSKGVRSR